MDFDRQAEQRRFGEEGRKLSYGTYLRLPEVLSTQSLLSDPPAHDEMLFIIVHQAYELWFKQILYELEAVRDLMYERDLWRAKELLGRVHMVERIMIRQVELLETMVPQDFLEFRHNLAPASGFQSVQFREIEFLSGLKDPDYLERLDLGEQECARLQKRLDEPTLWDAFCSVISARGLEMPLDDDAVRRESLLTVARDRRTYADEFDLSEALMDHDELFTMWRLRHVLMVERQIGTKSGTGGSTGSPYLRTTLEKRFYPELWELRTYL